MGFLPMRRGSLAELALEESEADVELLELAARAAWSVGLREQAAERAERWRELAATAGQDADLARALRVLARLRWEMGHIEAHRRAAREALAVAERLGPSEEQVLVFNLTAESEYLADHPEAAIEWADKALELAQEIGATGARGAILVNKGSALLELPDRWEEGVALLEQALREAEEAETQGDWVWPVERVRELVNRMAATAERSGWYDWLGYAEDVRAAILVEADGDLIAARAILNRQHRTEGELSSPHRFWAMMTGAELALESGDVQEATRLIERAGSSPLASSDQERRVSSLAAEVRLALRTRRRDESARLLQRMAELISRDETARARSFVIWFRTLREALRAGLEPERALACYREALVERGRRREPVAVADVHQGIARCLLVLRRYDELARRLYISPKTASVHVSNILTKLGMSSRAEIAAWAVREGLGRP